MVQTPKVYLQSIKRTQQTHTVHLQTYDAYMHSAEAESSLLILKGLTA